jgi:tetratricopeptide (TPR) repeat protein
MKGMNKNIILVWMGFSILFFVSQQTLAQDVEQQLRLTRELEQSELWEQAAAIYEALYAQVPDRDDLFYRYKEFCLKIKDYHRALELILDRKKRHPGEIDLLMAEAEMYAKMGDRDRAVQQWKKILDQKPKDLSIYVRVASSMTRERYYNEAVQIYLLARKKQGNETLFALNLANLYAAQIEYGKAASELIVHLLHYPNQASFVQIHLVKYPRTKKVQRQVREAFEKTIRAHPGRHELRAVLIDYLLRVEEYEDAFREALTLETLEIPAKRGNTLFEFGRKTFRAGAARYAELAYSHILRSCPGFNQKDRVLEGLARSYKAQNKLDQAVETYQQLFQTYPRSILARKALYQKAAIQKDRLFDFSGAEATLQTIIKRWPNAPESRESELLLGACSISQGKLDEAESVFQRIMTREEETGGKLWVQALVSLSEVLYLKGNFDKAISELDRLTPETVQDEASQDTRLNDGLRLRLLIKEHHQNNPIALSKFSRSEYLYKQRKLDESLLILDSLVTEQPSNALLPYALNRRGELAIELGRYKIGLASFDTLLVRFPAHLLADRALERSGWIMEKRGDKKEAFLRYEKLLTQYPYSLYKDEVRERIRRLEKEVKL